MTPKAKLLLGFLATTTVPALAIADDTATALPPEIAACGTIDDNFARLACYDRINPPRRAGMTSQPAPAPEVTASPPPAVAQTQSAAPAATRSSSPEDEFGLSPRALRKQATEQGEKPLDQLVAQVSAVSSRPTGELILQLANGQTWVQLEKRNGMTVKPGETVKITRGVLGSFMLSTESGLSTRARRVK